MMFEHYDGRNRGTVDQHLYCLYLITINDQQYVGQTNDTYNRFKVHRTPTSKCRYLINAIQLYGWENAKVEILLVDLALEEANRLETHYIDTLGTLAPGGYNLNRGGDNNEWSEESKQALRITLKSVWEDLGRREAMSIILKERWEIPGYRETMSTVAKKIWEDKTDMKDSMSLKAKERWEDNADLREAHTMMMKELWKDPKYREKQVDATKHLRKFTDGELIKMNEEFKGSVGKLCVYFVVDKSTITKHKKRLGLTGRCYNK